MIMHDSWNGSNGTFQLTKDTGVFCQIGYSEFVFMEGSTLKWTKSFLISRVMYGKNFTRIQIDPKSSLKGPGSSSSYEERLELSVWSFGRQSNKDIFIFFSEGTVTNLAIWLVLYALRILLSLPTRNGNAFMSRRLHPCFRSHFL